MLKEKKLKYDFISSPNVIHILEHDNNILSGIKYLRMFTQKRLTQKAILDEVPK